MRLPWQLNPWREVRVLRVIQRDQARQIREDSEALLLARRRLAEAEAMARQLTPGEPEGQLGEVEFVLVGTARGNGKRLTASRHVTGARFGQTDGRSGPVRWTLGVDGMDQVLFIDKPGYGEALDRMAEIWRNWDAETRAEQVPERTAEQVPERTVLSPHRPRRELSA